ncbi:Signal transduction histidine kinase [Geodermatophilus obscurus]|jgi:signal transduction histidine kinase|uniref:histidine kinase n=1 Tax=Geodermatophilus obscurus TaxID=1861 RepID=A0A1I5I617_9ACTN|nr:histidine kinase [Geodermatophilus obscurus]SFO56013.1 Signal transduction histidine kinase [Geodermatophilus obscurus]
MGLRARLWPGLGPRSVGFEVALALLGTIAVGLSAAAPDSGALVVVVPGTVLLVVTLALLRRRAPLVPFTIGAALSALSPAVTVASLFTAYAVGRYEDRWPVRAAAAAVGAVAVAQPWTLSTANGWVGAVGGALVVVLLPGALGAWARTRAELVAALTGRVERAEAERELMAREAVLTERTRIAREMHDAVGHRVSLMVLQAGAIEVAARDPERVEQLAGQVQAAGRRALEELRQMVGVLRAGELDEAAPLGPQPELADLPRLVEAAREAGMTVQWTGPAEGTAPVDPVVGRAAYRIVQEALTNAGKHAPDAPVDVVVERCPGELRLRVVNGRPSQRPGRVPGGGFGLVGLGERVRTLGGRLQAEPRLDGGFAVEAVLPA